MRSSDSKIIEHAERNHGTVHRFKNDKKKKVSTGIKAVLTSITRYWATTDEAPGFIIRPTHQPRATFAKNFKPLYMEVRRHYNVRKPIKKFERHIEEQIIGGKTSLPFYQARAYSQHVGLPTALLLLYSNIVSDATQGLSKKYVISLLKGSVAAINSLIEFLECGELSKTLYKEDKKQCTTEQMVYFAKLDGLGEMVKAFAKVHGPMMEEKRQLDKSANEIRVQT